MKWKQFMLLWILTFIFQDRLQKVTEDTFFYHSRDERQGAGVISNWDKFVTFGQIPVKANVRRNAPSAVDGVLGVALAVDGGLKLVNGG